jgi:MATE family multidrug resistance protein
LPKLYLDLDDTANLADNLEVISIASKLLIIAAVFQISDSIQVVTLAALRGMQDVKIPMFITFVAYWIIGLPVSYYLSMYSDYGSSGIWIGLLAGLTASAIMCFIRFNSLSKKLVLTKDS